MLLARRFARTLQLNVRESEKAKLRRSVSWSARPCLLLPRRSAAARARSRLSSTAVVSAQRALQSQKNDALLDQTPQDGKVNIVEVTESTCADRSALIEDVFVERRSTQICEVELEDASDWLLHGDSSVRRKLLRASLRPLPSGRQAWRAIRMP